MAEISDQNIQATLRQYGFAPDSGQCHAIRAYVSLLLRWNQRISLTTVLDQLEILRFHFGESLFAASSVPIEKGRLADVGSGAGFPGLPLRLAATDLSVTLIESNSRKAAFLAEVVRDLNLERVEVVRERMEALALDVGQFDFITARALGNHERLLAWAHTSLAVGGKIILWLGEEAARELSADSTWIWRDPIRIPGSKRRIVLVGSTSE